MGHTTSGRGWGQGRPPVKMSRAQCDARSQLRPAHIPKAPGTKRKSRKTPCERVSTTSSIIGGANESRPHGPALFVAPRRSVGPGRGACLGRTPRPQKSKGAPKSPECWGPRAIPGGHAPAFLDTAASPARRAHRPAHRSCSWDARTRAPQSDRMIDQSIHRVERCMTRIFIDGIQGLSAGLVCGSHHDPGLYKQA